MKPDDDDGLKAAFAEAHRSDGERMASFHQVRQRGPHPGRPGASPMPWLVTCATLVTAAGLAVWLVGRLGPPPAQLPMGTHWSGPTDFLLETPGLAMLRTVPEFSSDPVLRPAADTRRGNP